MPFHEGAGRRGKGRGKAEEIGQGQGGEKRAGSGWRELEGCITITIVFHDCHHANVFFYVLIYFFKKSRNVLA